MANKSSIKVSKAPSIKATVNPTPAPAPEQSVEAQAQVAEPAVAAETKAKRKYTVIGRDAVVARRAQVAEAAKEFLQAHGKPARQADIFRAVCSSTGLAQTPSVWNDLSLALAGLTKSESATLDKPEKKRGTYALKA